MTDTLETSGPTDYLRGGPVADLENAPLPTRKTLRARRGLVRQFFKFLAFDLTIMSMVIKGHGKH